MNSNLQRYLTALSLGARLALAAANGAAQHHLESPPAIASLPPASPARSAGTARATTDRGPESTLSGRVVRTLPLTRFRREPPCSSVPTSRAPRGSLMHAFGTRWGACCGSTPTAGPAGSARPRQSGMLELRAATAARQGWRPARSSWSLTFG
jgi:hypothetical protein